MTLQEKYEKQKEINKDLVDCNARLLTQAAAATKRIVALEKKNAGLIDLIHAERKRQEQCDDIHLKKIAELEKENKLLAQNLEDTEILNKTLTERDKELKAQNENQRELLTKAKELLNEFMRISKASDEDFEHDYSELITEAEQFLKDSEVEK